MQPLRIGLFGIGLDTYWPRFKSLKPRLESYVRTAQEELERPGGGAVGPAFPTG